MTARATRTLNPLHFEDLEPHRFEDLIRQLAYQFRPWRGIEATGRLGSDAGMDIRAIESLGPEIGPTGEEEERPSTPQGSDRVWVFQCKRERQIGPTPARRIIRDAVPSGPDPPYGFVLAAACDFSLQTRDAVRAEANARGVREVHLWGKAEIEDQLFLPANDHLLFAYFNVSLQVRRRSLKTELRSRLATKNSRWCDCLATSTRWHRLLFSFATLGRNAILRRCNPRFRGVSAMAACHDRRTPAARPLSFPNSTTFRVCGRRRRTLGRNVRPRGRNRWVLASSASARF